MCIKAGGGPWEVVGLLSWFNSNLYLGNKDGGRVEKRYLKGLMILSCWFNSNLCLKECNLIGKMKDFKSFIVGSSPAILVLKLVNKEY